LVVNPNVRYNAEKIRAHPWTTNHVNNASLHKEINAKDKFKVLLLI